MALPEEDFSSEPQHQRIFGRTLSNRRPVYAVFGAVLQRLLPAIVILFCATCAHAQTPVKEPRLAFDTTVHDFGRIPEGPSAEYNFRFTNTGDAPLVILWCTTADPHVATWTREPVLPGRTGVVTVTMPTRGRCCFPFRKTVNVMFNGRVSNAPRGWEERSVMLEIRGRVVEAR